MALPTNTFRPKRYFRTKFREGKYLLAAEATDIQLEAFEPLRELIKKTYGDVALGTSFLADQISSTVLRIRPGEAWHDGIPYVMKSGTDPKIIEGILETGATFDESGATTVDAGGKDIDIAGLANGNYSIVLEATEEIVRPSGSGAVDNFLQGANVGEETSNKVRTIYKINVVPSSDLNSSPTYPLSGIGIQNHLVNEIELTPLGGTGSGLANSLESAPVAVTQDPSGADVTVVFNNSASQIPFSTDADDFIHGVLQDSDGNLLTITSITTTDSGATVRMLLDREVQYNSIDPKAGLPVITSGVPFKLIKKDFYVTSSTGTPLGRHFYRIADFTVAAGNITSLSDLRTIVETNSFGVDHNIRLVGGGIITWEVSSGDLVFEDNFEITIPGVAGKAVVLATTVNLANDGDVAFLYLDRDAAIDYTETLTILAKELVPANVNVYVLAERRSNRIYFPHGGSIGDTEAGILGAFGATLNKDLSEDLIIDSLLVNQMDEVFAETFHNQNMIDLTKTQAMVYEPFLKQFKAQASARIHEYECNSLPNNFMDPWSAPIGGQVPSLVSGLLKLTDNSIADQIAYSKAESVLTSESQSDNRIRLRISSVGGTAPHFMYEIRDGEKHITLAFTGTSIELRDGESTVLDSYSILTNLYHEYRIVKFGDLRVQVFVDNVLVMNEAYDEFVETTSDNLVKFGTTLTATTTVVDIDYIHYSIYQSILHTKDVFRKSSVKYDANVVPESDLVAPWVLVDGAGGISHSVADSILSISDGSAINLINFEREEPLLVSYGNADIEMRVKLDSGSLINFEKFGIRLQDGRKDVALYLREDTGDILAGIYDASSDTLLSSEVEVEVDKYVVLRLQKLSSTGYQFFIDQQYQDQVVYDDFDDVVVDNKIAFGCFAIASNYDVDIDYVQYSLPGDVGLAVTPVKDFLTLVSSNDPFPTVWVSTDYEKTWYESTPRDSVSITDLDTAGGNLSLRISLSTLNSTLPDFGILYNKTNFDVSGQFNYYKETAIASQTLFALPWTFTPATNELIVHYRPIATGLTRKLTLPEDYTELSSTEIQLTFSASAGDILEFRNQFTKDPIIPPAQKFAGHDHDGSMGESQILRPALMIFPNMTEAERDALSAEAGMVIFNTDTSILQCFDGSVWKDLHA